MPENFIAGQWVAAQDGGRREIRCPADGELVAEIDESTSADTEAAIAAARAAFDAGDWPGTSARERGDLLLRVGDLLQRDKAELARMESLDTGKRLVESEIDIDDVTSVFRHFGRAADAEGGRVIDTGDALGGQPRRARAGRGLRPDHAVELPAAAGVLEGRPGARRRLHLRAQAQRALAPHRHPPDAPARGGRTACGRRQPGRSATDRTRARRSARTRASTSSPSPAGSAPASGSWPPRPAP